MSAGRLSGRVEHHDAELQARPRQPDANAKESHRFRQSVPNRVTAASVRRRTAQLIPIEYSVIDALNTVRIASGSQLRRLYWSDSDTGKRLARHHLAKLTKLRLIARLDRRVGGVRAGSDGFTYTLDVAGRRVANDDATGGRIRRPSTPGERFVAHALATTERYVELCELESAHKFELIRFEAEPDSWRHYHGEHGRAIAVKPDAFVIVATQEWEHRWFLEIDRATEHRPAILRKANDYLGYWRSGTEQRDNDVFPKVIWIAPDDARADHLRQWLDTLDGNALFDICTDATFVATIGDAFADSEAQP